MKNTYLNGALQSKLEDIENLIKDVDKNLNNKEVRAKLLSLVKEAIVLNDKIFEQL